MKYSAPAVAAMLAIALAVPRPASAELTRIAIAFHLDVLGGKDFGGGGRYEKIVGTAFFSVDPDQSRQPGAIVDLDKVARDAAGRVTFSADLYALVPKDAARANGAALLDILNRGRKRVIGDFNRGRAVADPTTEEDFGDGFLMRHGFTVVWLGWQFDIPHSGGLMGLDAPAVTEHGRPVTGRVTTRFVPKNADPSYSLADLGRYADTTRYPPVDPASAANRLTVRDDYLKAPRLVARDQWQFGRVEGDHVAPDISAITLKGGFAPGHVYDLSYEAKGAVVAGLGLAAVSRPCIRPRCFLAHRLLRHSTASSRSADRRTAASCVNSSTRASMPANAADARWTASWPTSPVRHAAATSMRASRGRTVSRSSTPRCFPTAISTASIR